MAVQNGMVTYYDGEYGEITKRDDKYIFLKHDIMSDVSLGSYVSFKGEEVQGVNRAYFVNDLEKAKLRETNKNPQKSFRR